MRWVLLVVTVTGLVVAIAVWAAGQCERRCSPRSAQMVGRDGICMCLVELPDGEKIWAVPMDR